MKIISEETKGLVVKRYEEGMSIRGISSEAGISQATVMKIVRASFVHLRQNNQYNEEKRNEVRRMYDSGMSILDIMSATGIRSEPTIYRIVGEPKRRKMRK